MRVCSKCGMTGAPLGEPQSFGDLSMSVQEECWLCSRGYDVDIYGRITSLGKFQGEMRYTLYLWLTEDCPEIEIEERDPDEDRSDLDESDEDRSFVIMKYSLEEEDRARFPELKGRDTVRLHERDDGFMYEV